MSTRDDIKVPPVAPLWGELRYGSELARLLAGQALRPLRRQNSRPVMLIPGFMAGDRSLTVLRSWLWGRGHPVAMSGLRLNVGCAEQIVSRLQLQLRELASERGEPVALIGQSRGGGLARALAVREPENVAALVMLGSPVVDPLAVSPQVLRTVRLMARLGDLGLSRMFSSDCAEGGCCEAFWADMEAPLPTHIDAISIFSRSDGIVDWHACLDPHARTIEVDSSHCGMSVHPAVYRILEELLDGPSRPEPAAARQGETAWIG